MKNKIFKNSLCFTTMLKSYESIRVYFSHSTTYKIFHLFTHNIREYSQHSKILNYFADDPKKQKTSLCKTCINKIQNIIVNFIKIINNIYKKSSINSFLFNLFDKEQKKIKQDTNTYIFFTLLGSIVSFSILSLLFNRLGLKQLTMSILFVIIITIFYLNSSNIIRNSKLVNIFIKLLDSNI